MNGLKGRLGMGQSWISVAMIFLILWDILWNTVAFLAIFSSSGHSISRDNQAFYAD